MPLLSSTRFYNHLLVCGHIFLSTLFSSTWASGQKVTNISVSPSPVTTNDVITIGVEYTLSTLCWSLGATNISQMGSNITINLTFDNNGSQNCATDFNTYVANFDIGPLPAGTYQVQLIALNGNNQAGSTEIVVNAPAPGNNDCTAPEVLSASNLCPNTIFTNEGATSEPFVASCFGPNDPQDVWFRFSVPTAGNYKIDLSGTSTTPIRQPEIALHSGNCNNLPELKCAASASNATAVSLTTTTPLNSGQNYFLRVSSRGAAGKFRLCIAAATAGCPTPPTPVISGNPRICNGGTTTLSATAGFAQYNWSTGGTNATISASAAGAYTVTVQDAAGCTGTASFTTALLPAIVLSDISGTGLSGSFQVAGGLPQTNAGNYASVTMSLVGNPGITASLSTAPFTHNETINFVAPQAGTYTVSATDGNGCSAARTYVLTTGNGCRAADSLALVALYNSTNGSSWTIPWGLNKRMNTWHGIALNTSGCVIEINLDSNNLKGILPAALGTLSNLKTLNIRNNSLLTGSIPSELGMLTALESLSLDFNDLSGSIPPSLGSLTNLKLLWVGNNKTLGGPLPATLSNLVRLENFALQNGQFSGAIPAWLGSLSQLRSIGFQHNQFSGTIPATLGNLKRLRILWLGGNQLENPIPNSLGNLDSLELLSLYTNKFTGPAPAFFGAYPRLRQLYISGNKFTTMPNLSTVPIKEHVQGDPGGLLVNDNQLTFEGILTNIDKPSYSYSPQDSIFRDTIISANAGQKLVIDLGIDANVGSNVYQWYKNGQPYQTINGTNQLIFDPLLPADEGEYWVHINNLFAPSLTLYGRKIQLLVTSTSTCNPIAERAALETFYDATGGPNWIRQDNWKTTMPLNTWYGITVDNNGCVQCLDLDGDGLPCSVSGSGTGNNLTGSLPPILSELKQLKLLNLFNNRLSGPIPPQIGSISTLEMLVLDLNRLSGPLPVELYQLTKLKGLGLNSNMLLEGSLSPLIGNLTQLTFISIGSNRFTGPLPATLGNLKKLTSLSINFNQFSGAIPPELNQIPGLNSFFANQNRFSAAPDLSALPFKQDSTNNPLYFLGLRLANNRLTFDDILPNLSDLNLATNNGEIRYAPQDSIFRDTTITKTAGQSLTIDLGIDAGLTTNVYQWFKNGSPWTPPAGNIASSNKLIFNFLSVNDAGDYWVQVTNPNAPKLTLYGRKIKLLITTSSTCNPTAERAALETLYDATGGPNWTRKDNWKTTMPLNTWYGIAVDNNGCIKCIGLDGDNDPCSVIGGLPGNNLTGPIPAVIGQFPSLEVLNLYGNKLSGSIPKEIGSLSFLKQLILDQNQLTGNIPPELGNLDSLISIGIGANQIGGTIPAALGNARSLQYLFFQDNKNISGNIPPALFGLPKLRGVFLQNNQLKGSVPIEVTQSKRLESLFVSKNQIDSVPNLSAVAFLPDGPAPQYQGLRVFGNKLTFDDILPNIASLQQYVNNPPQIRYAPQDTIFIDTTITKTAGQSLTINLGIDAGLTTNVYQWLKNGTNWTPPAGNSPNSNKLIFNVLQVSDAGTYRVVITNPGAPSLTLTGHDIQLVVLPDVSTTCRYRDSLELVKLYNATDGSGWNRKDNWLVPGKTIRDWYGVGVDPGGCVTRVSLSYNNLAGPIPDLNLPNLQNFECSSNLLSGSIPDFKNLPNLQSFLCDNNNLSGGIPDFKNLPNLQIFRCHNNQLGGSIPDFTNLPNLRNFVCAYNQLIGSIPDFTNLPNLQVFDCPVNKLSGTIPDFKNLPNLLGFYCWSNNLTGNIPDFNKLSNLLRFSCVDNKLSGNIPNFQYLFNLEVFNCSDNQLNGNIPDFKRLQNLKLFFFRANQFTFEDILPSKVFIETTILSNCTPDTLCGYSYAPQNPVFHDTLLIRSTGQNLDFSLDFDEGVATNVYKWYKDGIYQPAQDQIGNNKLVINNLQAYHAGKWTVQVTNPGAPDLVLSSRTITISLCTPTTPTISGPTALCAGTAALDAGSGFQGYVWSNGQSAQSINVSAAGTYTVTVRDANNCFATATASVGSSNGPNPSTNVTNAACGQNNGSIALATTGGLLPLNYTWSNGLSTQNIANLAAATYTVTVRDANNCSATATATVGNSNGPSATLAAKGSCGPDQGSVTLTVLSGTGTLGYLWSNGRTTKDLTGMPAATYTVTVLDAAGCSSTATAVVRALQPVAQSLSVSICKGSSFTLGTRSFDQSGTYKETFKTSEGCDSTVTLTLQVVVADGLKAADDRLILTPQQPAGSFAVRTNDQLPKGDTGTVRILRQPLHGTAEVDALGRIQYQLNTPGFTGTDSLTYQLCSAYCPAACSNAQLRIAVESDISNLDAKLSNTLTFNGDGVNDVFDPLLELNTKGYNLLPEQAGLFILNRMGEVVFEAPEYRPWPGPTSKPAQPYTYYYLLRLKSAGKTKVLKGALTVF